MSVQNVNIQNLKMNNKYRLIIDSNNNNTYFVDVIITVSYEYSQNRYVQAEVKDSEHSELINSNIKIHQSNLVTQELQMSRPIGKIIDYKQINFN